MPHPGLVEQLRGKWLQWAICKLNKDLVPLRKWVWRVRGEQTWAKNNTWAHISSVRLLCWCLNEAEASAGTDVGEQWEGGSTGESFEWCACDDECLAGGSRRRLLCLHTALQGGPGPPARSTRIDGASVLWCQHPSTSRVDKRSAARLTQSAEAVLSLFFDPATPPAPLSEPTLFVWHCAAACDGEQAPGWLHQAYKDEPGAACLQWTPSSRRRQGRRRFGLNFWLQLEIRRNQKSDLIQENASA